MSMALLADGRRGRLLPYLVHNFHHLGCGVVQGSVLHDSQAFGSLVLPPGQHSLVFLLNHDIWRVCSRKLYLAGLAQADAQHGGPWASPSVHSKGENSQIGKRYVNKSTQEAKTKPIFCYVNAGQKSSLKSKSTVTFAVINKKYQINYYSKQRIHAKQ